MSMMRTPIQLYAKVESHYVSFGILIILILFQFKYSNDQLQNLNNEDLNEQLIYDFH